MSARFQMTRGATLSLGGTVTLPAGTWTATSQVRLGGTKVADLTVELSAGGVSNGSASTEISLVSGATEGWPLGDLSCDIRLEDADENVLYSPTFTIRVAQEITHG